MKIKNVILTFILTISFICSSWINVSAANEIQVSELFKDYFTEVFLNPDKVTVLNKNKEDITQDFFEANNQYFENNIFVKIKEYYNNYIDEIYVEEIKQNSLSRSPFVTNSVSKHVYKELHKNQANGEISWYLKGTYVWDRATGRITSITDGAILIERINFGQAWSGTTNSMSTKSWLTDDDTVAHFKGSFNLKVSLTHEYVTVLTVDFGTQSAEVSGQPHE